MKIQIVPFSAKYQFSFDEMIREVIAEYSLVEALKDHKPTLPDLFWIAPDGKKVSGSVGLIIQKDYAVLKRMFLLADYRGKEKGISARLLSTATDWCKANNNNTFYLGTIDIFKAAMLFFMNGTILCRLM